MIDITIFCILWFNFQVFFDNFALDKLIRFSEKLGDHNSKTVKHIKIRYTKW